MPIGYCIVGRQVRLSFVREHLPEERQPMSPPRQAVGALTVDMYLAGPRLNTAVSIAANAICLAVGTEMAGSNVWTASCCGVHGLPLFHDSVSMRRLFRVSQTFDPIGLMANDPINYRRSGKGHFGTRTWV